MKNRTRILVVLVLVAIWAGVGRWFMQPSNSPDFTIQSAPDTAPSFDIELGGSLYAQDCTSKRCFDLCQQHVDDLSTCQGMCQARLCLEIQAESEEWPPAVANDGLPEIDFDSELVFDIPTGDDFYSESCIKQSCYETCSKEFINRDDKEVTCRSTCVSQKCEKWKARSTVWPPIDWSE